MPEIEPGHAAAAPKRTRPNFLFLVADQLPAHAVGFGGAPFGLTPNLDRLAKRSTVFDRAFVANPICMPNRASMITGRLPSSHGTRVNGIPLDPRHETFVDVLRRAGYRTGAAGKLHLQPYGAAPDVARNLTGSADDAARRDLPAGWDTWEHRRTHQDGYISMPESYYGFESVDLVVGSADTATGHYRHWLIERGYEPDLVQGRDNARRVFEGWDQVYQTAVPAEAYPTSYIVESTQRFLEVTADDPAPFMCWASFPDPHHPFTPPGAYADRVGPADVELPASFSEPGVGLAPHIEAMLADRGVQRRPFDCWAPTDEQYRHSIAAACGMIALLDDGIGSILSTLDQLGLADNTIVVFTSDHGDMWGEHGLLLKHGVHYESCTRVPLTIHVPGEPPRRTQEPASSLDLAPTVLGLADEDQYRDLHGIDLSSPARDTDRAILIEEDEIFRLPGLPAPIRIRTLITQEGRLTHYDGCDFGELYGRADDPGETVNRYADPTSTSLRTVMSERLLHAVVSNQDSGIAPRFTA